MEQRGLYDKYQITHADGTPVNPEHFHFVLNLSTDRHARNAARAYADSVAKENPELARDLRQVIEQLATIATLVGAVRRAEAASHGRSG